MSQDNESIIIIGGSNAGVSAATRIRRLNERANITIIEQSSFVGSNQAALPYFISGAVTSVEAIIADIEPALQNVYDIDLLKNCQVTRIDRKNRKLYVYNHANMQDFEMEYDKLVVATGFEYDVTEDSTISSMNNFFTLKNLEDAIKIRHFINNSSVRDIAIIGSNCISVKTAAALIEQGFNVTLIDKKPVLLEEFDDDFNSILKKEMNKADCTLYLNTDVRKYTKNADNYITLVQADGLDLKVDMVLYFDNIRPNTRLAQSCGCNVGSHNGLCVNADFRTNDEHIWAGGSAIELPDFLTNDMISKFSVSQSSFHGRQIGSNICGSDTSETHNVTNYFFKLKTFAIGIAGINEAQAKKSGYDYIIAEVFTGDH
ncbi:MAG: FAD-dependent oxidoreductase, partial [Spirochaetales bacterium]|nr:FAD-dependent oxidoreductase [Spirochaetales bacterium]